VSLERGDRGGQNGVKFVAIGWLVRLLRPIELGCIFLYFFFQDPPERGCLGVLTVWQWLGGSGWGGVGKRRSGRFEWC
jgi:hypothetical protein